MSAQTLSLAATYLLLVGAILFAFLIFATIISNLLAHAPFVPSKKRVISHIAGLAKIKKGDKVYDLGCGDGRFLFEAQKYTDVKSTGFENAPIPWLLTRLGIFLRKANAEVQMKNFLKADLGDADIIYCYLFPEVMNKIGEKFQKECRKGASLYSHTFSIRSMEPFEVWPKNPQKRLPTIYHYKVT